YTITVTHKNTFANGGQAYTLLVSGAGGTAYCPSVPVQTGGARIDSVSFQSIHFLNPASATVKYSDNTNLTASIEPMQTVPIYVKTGSSDGTNVTRYVKVFIDFNGNGSFADPGEMVAVSTGLVNGGALNTNISIPDNVIVGNLYLMRIVVEET
ncbi:hypothetical protein I5L01_15795, partial [Erythrobacter sp. YJ-T3-07]|uniref:GEVED domain-containing protein n=1 Tax=Erythrobacter sp. YJ-T3-07 TaxID=2793063 RepID=UPI0018D441EF